MAYPKFNSLGLLDEQVDEIRACITRQVGYKTVVDDHNTQFVVYEKDIGPESRGLLLRVGSRGARFHFFLNIWKNPSDINGRLKLRAYLEDQHADEWQFDSGEIHMSVKNKKGKNQRKGNVFYFVPDDRCHVRNFSVPDFYSRRESIGALAKSIWDKANEENYFDVDYSGCRLAQEGEDLEEDDNLLACEDVGGAESASTSAEQKPQEDWSIALDNRKWPQEKYGVEVVDLADLGSGVLSWVSTVDEIARKAAVFVRGQKVRPAKLRIPPYQRKFAWKEHDVRQLCKDLLAVQDKSHYHLGTIILHHERKGGEELWNVVDGQQRLTNIMAILQAPIMELSVKKFEDRDYEMICRVVNDYSEHERQRIREQLARCTLAFISVENLSEAFQLFTTQNGRGKPLTPVNLLKAYHYKAMTEADSGRMEQEEFANMVKRVETAWEDSNVTSISKAPGDGKLLMHVFRDYLYRLRLWSRGKFPQVPFNVSNIAEFKGVTIRDDGRGLPLQNGAVLRRSAAQTGDCIAARRPDDDMNPFVSVTQTIVNGMDFFEYASAYVAAYKAIFLGGLAKDFDDFYGQNCNPRQHRSGASMYARHVFEALCLFCYDRFGSAGLEAAYRSLFACAYFERVSQARVLYRRCGSAYAPRAVEVMMTACSVDDVRESLHELRMEVRTRLRSTDYVKSLAKKTKLTRGELLQRSACATIMK